MAEPPREEVLNDLKRSLTGEAVTPAETKTMAPALSRTVTPSRTMTPAVSMNMTPSGPPPETTAQNLQLEVEAEFQADEGLPMSSRRSLSSMVSRADGLKAMPKWVWITYDWFMIFVVLMDVCLGVFATVPSVHNYLLQHMPMEAIEILFLMIYLSDFTLRLSYEDDRKAYVLSWYGLMDLMSFVPSTLVMIFRLGISRGLEKHYDTLTNIAKFLRVLRVARFLKTSRFLATTDAILRALCTSTTSVFIGILFVVSLIFSSLMYAIEGDPDGDFDSIPICFYWIVVTLSTVGYGDLSPNTTLGRAFSLVVIMIGYGCIVANNIVLKPPTKQELEQMSAPWERSSEVTQMSFGRSVEELKEDCSHLSPSDRAALLAHLANLMMEDAQNQERDRLQ